MVPVTCIGHIVHISSDYHEKLSILIFVRLCQFVSFCRQFYAAMESGPASRLSFEDSDFTVGAYNCEGALSAAHYTAHDLIPVCDVLFLSETWLSRAEELYLPPALSSLSDVDLYLPPGAGEGRR